MPEREVKGIHPNELSADAKVSMKKRIIYGAAMVAVFVPCLILGGYFYMTLMVLIIGVATYEMAKVPGHKLSPLIIATIFVVMYALVFWMMLKTNKATEWKDFDINTSFNFISISPIALAVMIGIFFIVVIFKRDFIVTDAVYLIAMTLILALGFQGMLYIRYIPFTKFKELSGFDISTNSFKYFQSTLLMFYLLIAICFNDVGAYFIGVLFGKHKMAPRISPKKTWEGCIGGIVISFVFSTSFSLICAACGYRMLPQFGIDQWYWTVLCSALLPFFGNLGDFAFSAVKREFKVKDYSHILGPHGGILDRFDSTLFGALTLSVLVTFINNNWDFLLG